MSCFTSFAFVSILNRFKITSAIPLVSTGVTYPKARLGIITGTGALNDFQRTSRYSKKKKRKKEKRIVNESSFNPY